MASYHQADGRWIARWRRDFCKVASTLKYCPYGAFPKARDHRFGLSVVWPKAAIVGAVGPVESVRNWDEIRTRGLASFRKHFGHRLLSLLTRVLNYLRRRFMPGLAPMQLRDVMQGLSRWDLPIEEQNSHFRRYAVPRRPQPEHIRYEELWGPPPPAAPLQIHQYGPLENNICVETEDIKDFYPEQECLELLEKVQELAASAEEAEPEKPCVTVQQRRMVPTPSAGLASGGQHGLRWRRPRTMRVHAGELSARCDRRNGADSLHRDDVAVLVLWDFTWAAVRCAGRLWIPDKGIGIGSPGGPGEADAAGAVPEHRTLQR